MVHAIEIDRASECYSEILRFLSALEGEDCDSQLRIARELCAFGATHNPVEWATDARNVLEEVALTPAATIVRDRLVRAIDDYVWDTIRYWEQDPARDW